MKIKLTALFLFLLIPLLSLEAYAQDDHAAGKGMQFFHGSWDQMLAEAKKQNKPIIVDCYTSWCGPCKRMAADVFPQEKVGEFYNRNFVMYKLDMEKGEGPGIARKFQVKFYPTFIFLNPEGELIHKALGGRSPVDFVAEGQKALDPEQSIYTQINKFKKGGRDADFLRNLIYLTQDIEPEVQQEAIKAYWESLPPEKLIQQEHWEMYTRSFVGLDAKQYKYLQDNRKKFIEKYGEEQVSAKIYNEAGNALNTAIRTNDDKLFNQGLAILRTSDKEEVLKYAARAELLYLASKKDWKNFESKADAFVSKYAKGDARELHQLAYETYTGTQEKKLLKKAEKWVKESISLEENYYNTDTYAQILYLLGDNAAAEAMAKKAMEHARNGGIDYKRTQELLKNIDAAKKK